MWTTKQSLGFGRFEIAASVFGLLAMTTPQISLDGVISPSIRSALLLVIRWVVIARPERPWQSRRCGWVRLLRFARNNTGAKHLSETSRR